MEITERQKFILNKIVREYIQQAFPVSSRFLERKYDFGIKPASIRLELQKLTDLGYLEKPHISAGRVPTDKGYRFFVDKLFEKERIVFSEKKIFPKVSLLEQEITDSFKFFADLTKLLADFSESLALTYLADEMICFKEGWRKVFKEPEFQKLDCARDFMIMLQKLEEKMGKFLEDQEEFEVKVFIGKESKIPCAENFSLILGPVKFPQKRKGALVILGPKRMHYPRNIGLINSFVNSLEKMLTL